MISDKNRSLASSPPPQGSSPAGTAKAAAPTGGTATATRPASAAGTKRSDSTQTATTSLSQARNTTPGEPAGPQQPVLQNQANQAAKNRGAILTDPAEILSHELGQVEGAKEKYAALTEEQRTQFNRLYNSQIGEGTEVDTAPKQGGMFPNMGAMAEMTDQERAAMAERAKETGTRQNLTRLLAGDKLLNQDSNGDSLLQNLTKLREQPVAEGTDREALFRGVVGDTTFMPPQMGNVAVGQLNKTLAGQNPAEYAKVVGELASPEGRSTLGGTEIVAKPKPETDNNPGNKMGFGPSESSQLFQRSLNEATARRELFRVEVTGNPEKKAAFESLSRADQAKFRGLYQDTIPSGDHPTMPIMGMGGPMGASAAGSAGGMMGGLSGQGMQQPTDEQKKAMDELYARQQAIGTSNTARTGLVELLEKGKLNDKDSQGNSLVGNLHSIRSQDMASEGGHTLDRKQVLSEVISQINDPGTIRQNNKGTCTVTTVEHLLATRQPAEYARVMGELSGKSGSVTLQDGTTVAREKGIVPPDDSNRSNISRIFQATMMEYGNGADQDYRNKEDGHYDVRTGEALKDSDGDLRGGLSTRNWGIVSNSVLGTNSKFHRGTLHGGDRQTVENTINEALAGDRTVQVGMRWSTDGKGKHGYHALSVTGQDDQYVYLRNPWGSGDQGATDSTNTVAREALRPAEQTQDSVGGFGMSFRHLDNRPVADPSMSTGEAGSIRVKKEEFYSKLSNFLVEESPPSQQNWWANWSPF